LGHWALRFSMYSIIFLISIILLIPTQNADAIFMLSPESSEDDFYQIYRDRQIILAEQTRDKILDSKITRLSNPYHEVSDDILVTIQSNVENNIPQVVQRDHEIFQSIKSEQIDLAKKKILEILGGKIISNFDHDISRNEVKPIYEFEMDDQTGFMTRKDEDFKIYMQEEITRAELTRNGIFDQLHAANSNPYINNENKEISILENSLGQENAPFMLDRNDVGFELLKTKQVLLAEITLNQILDSSFSNVNPYDLSEEKIEDNSDIIESSELLILDQDSKEFQSYNVDQYKIIGTTSDGILKLESSLVIEELVNEQNEQLSMESAPDGILKFMNVFLIGELVNEQNIQLTMGENEIKRKTIDREDKIFQLLKQVQEDKAKEKLIEIYGGKSIHN